MLVREWLLVELLSKDTRKRATARKIFPSDGGGMGLPDRARVVLDPADVHNLNRVTPLSDRDRAGRLDLGFNHAARLLHVVWKVVFDLEARAVGPDDAPEATLQVLKYYNSSDLHFLNADY